jgi:hypothetical protein
MLPIFENDFKSLLEFIIFLLLISMLLLKLLKPHVQTFVFLLQIIVRLDFVLKFLIGLSQLDLDEVYFLLTLLQMRLDAVLGVVRDLVIQGKE